MDENNVSEYDKLEKYRNTIVEVLNKSNDLFEKQLSYISAGALGLSFILVEKVIGDIKTSKCISLLVCSWGLLGLTLVINLWSHLIAFRSHYKTINEINMHLNGESVFEKSKVKKRHNRIYKVNIFTLILLFLGLVSIILYTTINIL